MATHLLALDCSTEALAVAVAAGERAWCKVVEGGALASSRILGLALQGLADCGLGVAQLDAIAFGAGPGAFTGLRCACAAAQGLALGADRPLLAIDSLMLVADDARAQADDGDDTWVAMDARMDEVYAAHYRFGVESGSEPASGPAGWRATVPPALYTLEALNGRWRMAPPQQVAGSAIAAFGARLHLAAATVLPAQRDRAAALLRLARQAWRRGEAIDPAQALPLYLRDKVALTTLEREALQRARAARPDGRDG